MTNNEPKPVPVLARPGMIASIVTDEGMIDCRIVGAYPEHCVCEPVDLDDPDVRRLCSDVHTNLLARPWKEVHLSNVRPDPEALTAPAAERKTTLPKSAKSSAPPAAGNGAGKHGRQQAR